MAEITCRETLEAWLDQRPREDAMLIAARAALRSIPVLERAKAFGGTDALEAIILPSLRASSVSWVAAVGPTQGAQVQRAAYAAYAARPAPHTVRAFANAARAAYAAADVARAVRAAYVAAHAVAAAAAAAVYRWDTARWDGARWGSDTDTAERTFWETVSSDCQRLESGSIRKAVAASALWPEGLPPPVGIAWGALKEELLDADPGWWVWTEWYDDPPRGKAGELGAGRGPSSDPG